MRASGQNTGTQGKASKEVLVGVVERGTRLFQLVVKMKDAVGALSSVSGILAGLDIDVRQSLSYSVPEEGYAIYNAFLSLKDSEKSAQVVESLKRSKFVLEASISEGRDGVVLDTASFPANWQGRRVVIMAQHAIAGMFEHIHEVLGSGGAVLLYEQGAEYGKDLARFFTQLLGKDFIQQNLDYGLNLLAATGWGIAEADDPPEDFPNVTIRIAHCFECEGRSAQQPLCSFLRGFLTGAFGTMSGSEVRCEETSCRAKGDSVCAFEVKSVGP